MSMIILLLDEDRFSDFQKSLDDDLLDGVFQDMESRRVRLAMPKFYLETGLDLANVLTKMGMSNAFGEVTATPPALDAEAWLNPGPRTLNMKVHGEWQEFRVRSGVTRHLNDHVGF